MIPDNELLQHEVCALGNHHFLCPLAVGSWQDLAITLPMVWDHSRKKKAKVSAMSNKKSGKVKYIHTHTSFKCPSIYKRGLHNSHVLGVVPVNPPWLEVSRTSWSFFKKMSASQNCIPAKLSQHRFAKPSKPHPFWKNLRPLKKHLQDHKSSLDFVYFSNKQLDGFDECVVRL